MAKRKNYLYCDECGEFINGEDFVSCGECGAPLHWWCAARIWCEDYSEEYFCSSCAEELYDRQDCVVVKKINS